MSVTPPGGLDQQAVAAYLSSRLGAPFRIERMQRTFPGASRETYLVFGHIGEEPHAFALRSDPPNEGYGCPFPLRHEWEVYSRLWRSAVPVPEPLWYDEGLEILEGRPHMVRRLAEGSTAIPGLHDRGAEATRCAGAWRSSAPRSWPCCTRSTGRRWASAA